MVGKTIIVAKAAPDVVATVVEDCTIEICDPTPNFDGDDYPLTSLEFFEGQASVIVDALQTHLPGGTLDAVLRELCKRKACLLREAINS